MSWKKFGGTDKLDKMNMMNVNYIATDALSTSSPYVGDFDINGELTVYNKSFLKNDTDISGNVFISENVKISKNIDLSGDLTIDGEIISTQSISMTDGVFTGNVSILANTHLGNSIYYDATFIQGENQNPYGFIKGVGQSIGINTYTPEYTVDISSGSHLFRSYTNNVSGESILLETNSHQPLAKNTVQLDSDPSMIGIRFGYKGDTVGNIFMNENKFAIHSASYMDISSDNMTIGKHKTNMDNSSVQFERLTVYDNATTNYLNDSESLLGQSIACIASDNSSVTFVSLTTPNQVGVHIGGGVYPTDKSKAYGALTLHENEIPSISLLQGDHFVQNRTTIGINTYKPKVNKYALDINGPVHIENGQIEKTLVSSFEIKTFTKSNKPTSTITTYGTPSTLRLDLSDNYYIKSYYVSNTNGENWDKNTVITGEEDFNTSKNAILCAYTYIDNSNNRTHLIAGEGGYIFKKQYTDFDWVFIGGQSVTYKGVWTSETPYYYTCMDPTQTNNNNARVYRISKTPIKVGIQQINTYTREYMTIPGGLTNVNAMNGFTYSINTNYTDTLFVVGVSGIYSRTGWFPTNSFDLVPNTNTKTYYDVAVYYHLVTTTHHVIAVGDDIISVSINNGATWTHTGLTGMWKSVFISSTYAVIGGNGGSIKYSAYPYTVWNDIPESILNSSGNRSLLSNVNIQNILMPDANTLLLHSTPIPFQDISGSSQNTTGSSSIYYCYLPQLFNPYDDFVFDISGSTHLDGDVFIKRNLHTKNMATFEGNVDSTAYTNGTVTVIGGIGIEGNANIHKNIDIGKTAIIRNNDASANTLVVIGNTLTTGNANITGNMDVSNIRVLSTVDACLNAYPFGACIVNGGIGIQKNAYVGNSMHVANTLTTPQLIIHGDDAINYSTGAIQLIGGMGILGNLYVQDLTVIGNTKQDNNTDLNSLNISSDVNATDTSSGAVIIAGGTAIKKDIYIGGNSYLLQNVRVFDNLDVSKNVTVDGSAHFIGEVIMDTSVNLLQNQTVNGNVVVHGNSTVNNLLDVSFARVRGRFDVSGNVVIDGNATIKSNVTINQNIRTYGTMDISNIVTITHTDNAVKNGSVGSLHTYGGAMVKKDLIVYGNVDVSNTLIANSIQLNGANATSYRTGAIQLIGGMGISGELFSTNIVSDRIDVSNLGVLTSVIIHSTTQSNSVTTGALTISGGVGIGKDINVRGNALVRGNTQINGNTDICGNITTQYANLGRVRLRAEVDISGTTTMDANLNLNFSQTVRGTMDICGNTTVSACLDASFGKIRGYWNTFITDSSSITVTNTVDVSGQLTVGKLSDLSSVRVRSLLSTVIIDASHVKIRDQLDISGNLRVDRMSDLSSVRVRSLLSTVVMDASNVKIRDRLDISGQLVVDGMSDLSSARIRSKLDVGDVDASNVKVLSKVDISGQLTVVGMSDLSSARIRTRLDVVDVDASNVKVLTKVDISGQLAVVGMSDLSSVRVRSLVSTVIMDASHIKIRDQLDISGNLRVDRISDLSSVRVRSLLSTVDLDVSNAKIRNRVDLSGQLVVDGMSDLSSARIRTRLDVVDVDASNVKVLSKVDISGQLTVVGMSDLSSARIRTRLDVVDVDASNVKVLSKVDISGQLTVVGMSDLSSARIRSRLEVLNLDVSNVKVFSKVDISGQLIVDGMSDLSSARIRSRLDVGDVDSSNVKVLSKVDISGQLAVVGMSDLSSVRVRSKVETVNLDVSNIRVTTAIDVSGNVRVDGYTDLSWGTVQNTFDVSNLEVQSTNIWKQLDVVGNCRIRTALLTNMDASFVHISLLDVSGNMTVDGYSDLSGARIRNKLDVSYIDISNGRVTNNFDISGQLTVGKLSDLSSVRIRSKLDVVDVDASNVKVLSKVDISGQLAVVGMSDLSSARIRSKLDVGDVDASNVKVLLKVDISGQLKVVGMSDLSSARIRSRLDVGDVDASNVKVLSNVDISGQLKVVGMSDLSSVRIRSRLDVGDVDVSNVKVLSKVDISGQLTVVGMSDLSSVRIRSRLDVGDVDASNVKISTSLDVSGNVRMDGPVDLSFVTVRNRVDLSGIVRVDGLTDLSFMRVRNRVDISGVVRIDGNMDLSYVAVRNKLDVSGNMVVDGVTDLSYTKIKHGLDLSGMDVYANIVNLNYKTYDISKPDETSLTIDSNVTVPSTKTVWIDGQDVKTRFNYIEGTITDIQSNKTTSLRELNLGKGDCSNVNLKSTVKIELDAPTILLKGILNANNNNINNVKNINLNSGADIKINNVSIPDRISSLERNTLDFSYESVDDIGTLTIGKTAKYDYINLFSNNHLSLTSTGGNVKFGSTIDASKNSITNVNNINAGNIYVSAGGDIQIGGVSIAAGLLESNNIWKGDMNRFNVVTASGYLSVSGEIVSTGDISAGGHVKVKGNLDISGNSRVQQTMDMSSALVRNHLTVRGDCSFSGNLDASYGNIRNLKVANTYDLSGRLGNLTHITNSLYNSFHNTDGVSTDTTIPTLNIGWNGLESTNTDNFSKYIAVRATEHIGLISKDISINGNVIIIGGKTLTLNGTNIGAHVSDISGRTRGITYNTNTSTTDISNLNIILSASGNITHTGNTIFNGDLDMNNYTINDVSSINVNNGGSLTIGSGGSIIVGGTTFTSGSALLSSSNSWTGSTNTFNNEVIIGTDTAKRVVINNGNVEIGGNVTINGYMNSISYITTNYFSGAINQPNKLLHLGRKPDGTNDKELVIHADNSLCMWANNIDIGLNGTIIMRGTTIMTGNVDMSFGNTITINGYDVGERLNELTYIRHTLYNIYTDLADTNNKFTLNIGWYGAFGLYADYVALRSNLKTYIKSPEVQMNGNLNTTGSITGGSFSTTGSLTTAGATFNGDIDMNNYTINDVSSINVNSGGSIKIGGVSITSGSVLLTSTNTWSGTTNTFNQTVVVGTGSVKVTLNDGNTGNIKANNIEGTTFKAASDYRIKSNCVALHNTTYTVDLLKPITYYNTLLKQQDIGFLAHEVQEVYPFLVDGEKDGEKNQTLNYIGMIGILVKEIQELKQKVKRLEENMNIV